MASVTPTTSAAVTASASGLAAKSLTENFDTFLKLLTVQMQNQDPLKPLETNEFTQQLVSFTGVEQAIQQNRNLETLIAEMRGNGLTSAATYIGQTVTADTDIATLSATGADWSYTLESDAQSNQLAIATENGEVMVTLPGETKRGTYSVHWDGKLADGTTAPAGRYRLVPVAKASDSSDVTSTVHLVGRVDAVESSADGNQVIVAGTPVSIAQIIRITQSSTPQNVVSPSTTTVQ